jgi:hypothetical protein
VSQPTSWVPSQEQEAQPEIVASPTQESLVQERDDREILLRRLLETPLTSEQSTLLSQVLNLTATDVPTPTDPEPISNLPTPQVTSTSLRIYPPESTAAADRLLDTTSIEPVRSLTNSPENESRNSIASPRRNAAPLHNRDPRPQHRSRQNSNPGTLDGRPPHRQITMPPGQASEYLNRQRNKRVDRDCKNFSKYC